MGFEDAAGFVELYVDAIIGFVELGDVRGGGAGLVGEDGQMDLAADVFGFFEHVRGHGLLDEFNALGFQPVNFADGFFFVSPTFVGIYAERLVCDAADSADAFLVGL